ncbi:MAG TPA: hypothetical protein VJ833_12675 [Rhodanobacteraceae bacterium]|nr:hypothetical protein [Rhodanobacteraceae bacterium]
MPPINITPLGVLPDAPRPQTPAAQPGSKPVQPITGKVYALKDGSGYAALASDGHYYRVDTGRGHGLTFSRAGGFVDVAMVDMAHGLVQTVETRSDQDANTTADVIGHRPARRPDDGVEVRLSGKRPRNGLPKQHPALKNAGHAVASSREAHTLIMQKPAAAVDSQANLSAQNVLSLLD